MKHCIFNLWFLNINRSMSEWICPKRQKKRRLVKRYDNVLKTAWTDEFHFIKHSRKGNKFAFCESAGLIFQSITILRPSEKIPFFHGFIILYLKFWLHRFYIQNAAECTILHPTTLSFSISRDGMYIFFQKDQTRVCNITFTWLNSLFVSKNKVM